MKKKDYIKFNGYEIIKMHAERISVSNEIDENSSNKIEHFYKILPLKEDFSEIQTYQGIKFSGSHDLPYDIEVVLKGNFSIFLEQKKEVENMILFNIPAIQYPFLRSSASMITSIMNINAQNLLLPTINFMNLMQNTKIEEIILKNE